MRVERSIEIARPREEVFAFVADPLNDMRWCSRVKSVEQVEGNGPAPGARYAVVHQPVKLRKASQLDHRIVELTPPGRIRFREEDDDGVFDVVYELEESPAGTRLTQRDHLDLKLPRLLWPIARRNVGRHLTEQLEALKRLLERRD
ncbi:MAG: SRPBCC family protein [Thermoleophilaceae bacterium]